MNGCCFVIDNCPRNPLHNNCHCYYIKATSITVTATSSIGKYINYLFDENNNKGKKDMFESWGYTISDAEYLKREIERQAMLAIQSGDYILGRIDSYGQ